MMTDIVVILAVFYAGLVCGVLICAHGNAAREADDQADRIERRL